MLSRFLESFLNLCFVQLRVHRVFQILCKLLSCSTFKGFQRMFRTVLVRLWGGFVCDFVNVFLEIVTHVLQCFWGLNQLFKFCCMRYLTTCWSVSNDFVKVSWRILNPFWRARNWFGQEPCVFKLFYCRLEWMLWCHLGKAMDAPRSVRLMSSTISRFWAVYSSNSWWNWKFLG